MEQWTPAWQSVPVDYGEKLGTLENISQTAVFRNNLRGSRIRARLNNRGGTQPMVISHGSLILRNRISGERSPELPLTMDGRRTLRLEPNSCPLTDEIRWPVTAEDDLIVRLYFGEKTDISCVCLTWAGESWMSWHQTGDYAQTRALGFTNKSELMPGLAADVYPNYYAAGLCSISVLTEDAVVVGLFGDSITHMGYFSDSLTRLLYERYPGRCSVINGGICGNRAARPGPAAPGQPGKGKQMGPAGAERYLGDLCTERPPEVLFLMEGVNDCGHALAFGEPLPTAEEIFSALSSIILQAREGGSYVLQSTVMPFGAFLAPWRERANDLRLELNGLIRRESPCDRLADLDAVMRDPRETDILQEGMHLGDGVHPNRFGGEKMAAAVLPIIEDLLMQRGIIGHGI